MNLTAKIFVVLILIMSLAFMFVQMTAFATRENWKRRWDKDLSEATARQGILEGKLSSESFGRVFAQAQHATVTAEAKALSAKLSEEQAKLTGMIAERNRFESADKDKAIMIVTLQNEIASKQTTIDNITKRIGELDSISRVSRSVAHALTTKITEVEDDLNTAQGQITRLETKIADMDKKNRTQEARLAMVQKMNPSLYESIVNGTGSSALVDGIVAGIHTDPKGRQQFVVITIGSKDGAQPGTSLLIANKSDYICRVIVEKVEAGMALCQVVNDSWNSKNLPITMGDRATNKF